VLVYISNVKLLPFLHHHLLEALERRWDGLVLPDALLELVPDGFYWAEVGRVGWMREEGNFPVGKPSVRALGLMA
jgi:hypothetical protein